MAVSATFWSSSMGVFSIFCFLSFWVPCLRTSILPWDGVILCPFRYYSDINKELGMIQGHITIFEALHFWYFLLFYVNDAIVIFESFIYFKEHNISIQFLQSEKQVWVKELTQWLIIWVWCDNKWSLLWFGGASKWTYKKETKSIQDWYGCTITLQCKQQRPCELIRCPTKSWRLVLVQFLWGTIHLSGK